MFTKTSVFRYKQMYKLTKLWLHMQNPVFNYSFLNAIVFHNKFSHNILLKAAHIQCSRLKYKQLDVSVIKPNHDLNNKPRKTQINYVWTTAIIALMVIYESTAEACDTEFYTITYGNGVPIFIISYNRYINTLQQ